MEVDVAVLGAGPAGTIAAAGLARAGLGVALIGPEDTGGGYDVLVTSDVIDAVTSADPDGIAHRPVRAVDVLFGGRGRGALTDVELSGCRFDALASAFERAALAAGAVRVPGTGTATRTGAHWTVAVGGALVRAAHVVLATGAAPGPGAVPVHAQLLTGCELGDRAAVHLAAPHPARVLGRPAPVLLTPSDLPGTITVTATGYASIGDALAVLAATDARCTELLPAGPVHRGTARTAFTPSAGVRDGALVVGDHAGLVNPFLGTGIGTAAVTARLAATAIVEHADDPAAAATRYVQLLGRDVIGHTGAAAQAARRYHLAWRVLADTADNDNPFFAKSRKAILLPDGIRQLGATRRTSLGPGTGALVAPFLLTATQIAVAAVRRDWPFVASLIRMENDQGRQDVRPALLFAGAAMAAGEPPGTHLAGVAAAIELAMLGMLALTASGPTTAATDRGVDWPSATAVLAGDVLLANAARLVARHEPELSGPFADWMAALVTLRARRLDTPPDLTASVEFFASLFEFPAWVAAQLAGCDDGTVARLREFGDACGRVFLHAEDLLALRGGPTRLDATVDSLRQTGLSGLPALTGSTEGRVDVVGATTAACLAAHRQAARLVGNDPSGQVLAGFLAVLADPATGSSGHS